MAEQEDMARLLAQVNMELEQYGRLTADTAEKLKYAQTGIANFEKKMSVAGDVLNGVTKAFVGYTKAVYAGEHGSKAFNSSLDAMSDAVQKAAVGLAVLAPGGVVIKGLILALGYLTSKLMEAGKEVNEQTDKIFDAFQELGRAGAAAADGMQGVFDGLQKMGLGVEQFANYTKVIEENASQLAMFGSTVAGGRHALEDTVKGLRSFRTDLGVMGLDRTKVVEATAQYIRVQQTLTRQTKEQMDLSGDAVMKYVKETDLLTRITGASRKKQEEIMEESMSEDIFASKIDEMMAAGGEAAERAKKIQMANLVLTEQYGKETARAYRDSITGFVGASDSSKKFLMSFGAEGQQFIDRLSNTNMSTKELGENLQGLAKAGKETNQAFLPLTQMGGTENFMLSYKERRKADKVLAQDLPKAMEKAQQEINKQLNDPDARRAAEIRNNQQDEQIALQGKVNLGMSLALIAQAKVTYANKRIAEEALAAAKALGMLAGKENTEPPVRGTEGTAPMAETAGGAVTGARLNVRRRPLPAAASQTSSGGSSKADLEAAGLRIKQGDVQQEGKSISGKLIDLAKNIQENIPGFKNFTGFNDKFHNEQSPGSKHTDGLAADFVLDKAPTAQEGQALVSSLMQMGASKVIDEYNNPSAKATAGHFHVEIPKFEFGGILGAGKMGIAGEAGPELISGPASITPMNDLMRELGSLNEVSSAMLAALRDIARKQGEVADTSKRMLQVAQN